MTWKRLMRARWRFGPSRSRRARFLDMACARSFACELPILWRRAASTARRSQQRVKCHTGRIMAPGRTCSLLRSRGLHDCRRRRAKEPRVAGAERPNKCCGSGLNPQTWTTPTFITEGHNLQFYLSPSAYIPLRRIPLTMDYCNRESYV